MYIYLLSIYKCSFIMCVRIHVTKLHSHILSKANTYHSALHAGILHSLPSLPQTKCRNYIIHVYIFYKCTVVQL